MARVRDGFAPFDITTRATTIHGVTGGSGPPVLLLHGIPETRLMWHRVAPALAERCTVVATDLRGYGASGTPPSAPDHGPYSMREIGHEQFEVMGLLRSRAVRGGRPRSGTRCAYRIALDHRAAVDRLAVLDIVPTGDTIGRAGPEFALAFWVWSFLAAPEPLPETLVAAAPDMVVGHMFDAWAADGFAFPDDVRAAYVAPFRDPATVHAVCEEYRAAHSLDAPRPCRPGGGPPHRLPGPRPVERFRDRGHLVRPPGGVAGVGGRRAGRSCRRRPLPARGGAGRRRRPSAAVPRRVGRLMALPPESRQVAQN